MGKQIGGLGDKFGSYTEGLALPSMQKILRDRFGAEVVSLGVRIRESGREIQIDALAYANGEVSEAYAVEAKSHAREESLRQLRNILAHFRDFFPEHRDKKVFGILAAVDVSANLRARILEAGRYVARIREDIFELDIPGNFRAKAW